MLSAYSNFFELLPKNKLVISNLHYISMNSQFDFSFEFSFISSLIPPLSSKYTVSEFINLL